MKDFAQLLLGKNVGSITKISEVVQQVRNQESFDRLFPLLLRHERTLGTRAAMPLRK